MGWLDLTIQGSAFTTSMITPAVSINGYRVPSRYGQNVIPLYAGPTRIEVHCQWLRQYGQATLDTVVPAGGTVQVFYASPWHQFSRGRIGYDKQSRPGFGLFVAIIAVVVVVAVLLVALNL